MSSKNNKDKKREYDSIYHKKDVYKKYQKKYGKIYRNLNKDKIDKYNKEYYEKNKDKSAKTSKKWRLANKERIKSNARIYIKKNRKEINRKARLLYHKNKHKKTEEQKNKERKRVKEYRLRTKEQKKQYDKNYKIKNKKFIYKRTSKYIKKRKLTDVGFRIRCNLSSSLSDALCGRKSAKTLVLLGCSINEFKVYLELLFSDGMNWGNYGKWHLDHIIPCDVFDLSKKEAQEFCFHCSNYQPMWGNENILKSNKIDIETLKKLDINLLKDKYKKLLA